MVWITKGFRSQTRAGLIDGMLEDRKRVFVDLLQWNVPVIDGRFEIDQFDDDSAVYVIVDDAEGNHLGSARLLSTNRNHILKTIFPELCAGEIPAGAEVREITRFCLSPRLSARERLQVRKQIVTALVLYALHSEITTYSGVAERAWFEQIVQFGWRCQPLAPLVLDRPKSLVGLRIDIDDHTIQGLVSTGMYTNVILRSTDEKMAA